MPQIAFAFEARVTLDPPVVVGQSSRGLRRIVPITGGTVEGPRIRGRILEGGADVQVVRPDGVLEVLARYAFETDDGAVILIVNWGLRHGPEEILDRLARGEPVAPSSYYFRTSARFEAPLGSRHEWLNRAIFIGDAERHPDVAIVRFFEVE